MRRQTEVLNWLIKSQGRFGRAELTHALNLRIPREGAPHLDCAPWPIAGETEAQSDQDP